MGSYIDSIHEVIFQSGNVFSEISSKSTEDFKVTLAIKGVSYESGGWGKNYISLVSSSYWENLMLHSAVQVSKSSANLADSEACIAAAASLLAMIE